jgi:amino acid adenylation domain-containing protein
VIVDNEVSLGQRPELSANRRTLLEKWLRGEFRRPANVASIPRRSDSTRAPLSYAQQRLWFFHQLEPDSPLYNTATAVHLQGRLDPNGLQQALSTIIRRHEVLRARFVSEAGNPKQIIGESPEMLPLPVIDLSRCPVHERESEAERLLRAEASRPFDLTRDLMLRATLARLDQTDHVLVISMHHIASDGWSLGVLFRELTALYEGFAGGDAPSLPELPIQYPDYALWQRESLQGAAMENQLAYWRRQLASAPEFLELPADHPRPTIQTFRGHWQWQALTKSLAEALKGLSQRQGATLFMTLLAAFKALVHRYTNQEDVLVGSPSAGRGPIETESLIGFFINTLVLRTDLSGNPTFRELLLRVREVTLGAYAHQDLPFDRLVQELRPERTAGHTPLVQVLFVLQNTPAQNLKLPGLTISPIPLNKMHTGTSKFDLTFQIEENDLGMTVAAEYNTDLFERDTIVRMLGNFKTFLEGIIANPDQRISDLPLLAPAERRRVLVEWNDTHTVYPAGKTIPQLFEEQQAKTPDSIAVKSGGHQWTYRELDARSSRMAQALRSRGISRGQRVGLCVERGADMLAAVLGILKAGAAYVPLDPSFPEGRLRFMADDAQLALLVSTAGLAGSLGLPRDRQLRLDADAEAIAFDSATSLTVNACTAQPGDPAYVIYTSGSTGKPKGVVVPHRAVVNFLTSMAREPGLTADDVLVAITTLSFDIAVLELHLPLTLGATVVIATHDETVDGHALGSLLERHRATVMQATPVTWRLLLESGWNPRTAFKALVGGEALPRDLAVQLIACGVELWNMYGPTETTVWSTCARISNTSDGITIGKPIANTTVLILDAREGVCPIGAPGELCIGGDGVALGYWNRPELTAERFIPDPFSTTPGATLYRTGDRARWRNDGTLEHLGRLDFQVKLRGFRIEVGEIETGIAQHPAVREVAVIAREDTQGNKCLVAYLVAENPPADLVDQLRALVRAAMPEYMVPAQFVMLKALPRTHNGKLDRKALPAPSVGDDAPRGVAVAPRTPTEEMIMGVFRTVLGRTDFGVFDNFFDLGGHSLMAARIMFQLRAASGRDLPLRVLFERPSVSVLAEAIDALSWLAGSRQLPAVASNRVEIEL